MIIRAQKFLTLEDFSSQIKQRKIKNIKIIVSNRYCYSRTEFLSANDLKRLTTVFRFSSTLTFEGFKKAK
mgnify:CR=1 FL=1